MTATAPSAAPVHTHADRVGLNTAITALTPAIWGSTYLVTTEFLPPDRPLLAATVRALPAGLLLVAFARALPPIAWLWRLAVLGFLNIGAFFYLLFVAAYHLPGGLAAVVMAIQPTLVLVLGAALLRERITMTHALACVLGVAGVSLLVLRANAGLDLWGVLAGLTGALSMAAGLVLTKRWGRPPNLGVFAFTGWQLAAGGLMLLPVTLVVEGVPTSITGRNVAGFLYLSVIGALLAYALWFRGIERLPALTVSFLAFASPLMATILGYVVLGQSFSVVQWAGVGVVVVAVVLAQPHGPTVVTKVIGRLAGQRRKPANNDRPQVSKAGCGARRDVG